MSMNRENILVIDDDVIMQRLIMSVLTKAGYVVRTASDVSAGLELIDQEMPDIVLCDMVLPLINGLDFLKYCRSTPALADLRVIIISSANNEMDVRAALDLGAAAYISKPFSQAQLLDVVANLRQPRV